MKEITCIDLYSYLAYPKTNSPNKYINGYPNNSSKILRGPTEKEIYNMITMSSPHNNPRKIFS